MRAGRRLAADAAAPALARARALRCQYSLGSDFATLIASAATSSTAPTETATENASLARDERRVHGRGMKLAVTHLAAIALLVLLPAVARADEASHRAAAEQLLNLMEMEKMMSQSVDQMLAMQMKQSPGMAQYEPQMRAFLSKYMSWGTVKEDMVKIYMAEFTEPEIKELIKFYQTDVGKKTVQKMPTLLAKSAELSQKRMQEHMPELQQAIQGSAAAQSPAAPAASAAATASPAKKGP